VEAFKDHFSAVSDGYRAFRPGYPPALFAWLASVSPGRERAVDLGCGSGQASVGLARHFEEVIGVDPSAEQVARAVAHPQVRYRVAPAEATGLPAACADLVTAAQSAHWFDPEGLRRELERIARPGAIFSAFTYGLTRVDPAVDAVVFRFFRDVLGRHWPPETAHIGTGYRTLPFPWPEIEAPTLAHRESWTVGRLLGYLGTWSAAGAFRRETGDDPVALVEADLRAAWGPAGAEREVAWDLAIRAGRIASGRTSPERSSA
jgi:SAM-dependent methyltransferase